MQLVLAWNRIAVIGLAALTSSSCAVVASLPEPATLEQRLAMMPLDIDLPLDQPVTIHWNEQGVPFIEAKTDHDAAFALGLAHAHLRLGQMEMLRRISQARLQEMAGPIPQVAEIEQALRILNFGKTSKNVYARMAPNRRAWLDAFVAGVNTYQQNVKELPHEFTLLGFDVEPWRPEEVLTIGRLASVDVSWLAWLRLMPLRNREDWPQIWAKVLDEGTSSAPSITGSNKSAAVGLSNLLSSLSRTGSNSMAVGKSKTGTGSALLANDPHLGVNLPNAWLLAGIKCPSYNTVGFMVPGVPFVAVGRNPWIAWGGTNMRSANSDLFDVSKLPPSQITTRTEAVRVRWWFDDEITIRETPVGPILSDATALPVKKGEVLALKWIGHYATDELSAMLGVNQARNWADFRRSLEGFSIAPQNFLYADVEGNIGQVTATHVPARGKDLPADIVLPLKKASAWDRIVTSRELPMAYNPPSGFLASANNRSGSSDVPIGYLFSADDRVLRMQKLLGAKATITPDDIKEIQMDTISISALLMRDAIVKRAVVMTLKPQQKATLEAIDAWDGRYRRESAGAVAFEATISAFLPVAFTQIEIDALDAAGSPYTRLSSDVATIDEAKFAVAIAAGLDAGAIAAASYPTWGDMHRMGVQGYFATIPVIGSRYNFGDVPAAGTAESVLKTDHPMSAERHLTRYGAQARHVSDLSNPDANWFVLLGGNDGWYQSANFRDQLQPFMDGKTFKIPLRIETVRATFPIKTKLKASIRPAS